MQESKAGTDQIHNQSKANKAFALLEPSCERLNEQNPILPATATAIESRSIGSLYLAGFNHSRPNIQTAFTEGPHKNPGEEKYQHPQYTNGQSRQRFKEGYDYYSVGSVLLEIGLWKSLSDLIGGDIEDYTPLEQQKF